MFNKDLGIFIPKKTSLEEWAEKVDSVFKTLILPVSFLITIVSTFLFQYFGRIYAENTALFMRATLASIIGPIIMFIFSVSLWSVAIVAEKREKFGIGLSKWTRFFSLFFMWLSLLFVPAVLISLAFALGLIPLFAFPMYPVLSGIGFGYLVYFSRPPKTVKKIKRKSFRANFFAIIAYCFNDILSTIEKVVLSTFGDNKTVKTLLAIFQQLFSKMLR